jgi:hypothetical protein
VICLAIFVDPSLVMRTLSSFNHSGPDEVPIAISLRQTALKASGFASAQPILQASFD